MGREGIINCLRVFGENLRLWEPLGGCVSRQKTDGKQSGVRTTITNLEHVALFHLYNSKNLLMNMKDCGFRSNKSNLTVALYYDFFPILIPNPTQKTPCCSETNFV